MYVHYQSSDNKHEAWKITRLEQADEVRTQLAKHMSMLAISKIPATDEESFDDVTYKGDLCFDIDHADIADSISDLQRLLDALISFNVDLNYCRLFASGGKGFHVIVPARVFSKGEAVKFLPHIYRWMAARIAVSHGIKGLDMALYHGKRGSLLRVENKLRADGKYKVPLSVGEARAMNPQMYAAITTAPREVGITTAPKSYVAMGLGSLFEQAKEAVKAAQKARAKAVPVPDEALAMFGDSTTPRCIEWITQGVNLKDHSEGINFNRLAMSLSSYLGAVKLSDTAKAGLVNSLASTGKSTTYKTERDRVEHIQQQLEYNRGGAVKFSCAANCSALTLSPCSGCPVQVAAQEEAAENQGIVELKEGYFRLGAKNATVMITNFTLEPIHVYCPPDKEGEHYEAVEFNVLIGGVVIANQVLTAAAWDSAAAFKKAIADLRRVKFVGSDHDVQNLKAFLLENHEMQEVVKVHTAGVHRHHDRDLGIDTFVYVEPNWSINHLGVTGTHTLMSDLRQATRMQNMKPAGPDDDDVIQALHWLLDSNRPHVVGSLLGWVSACHLKAQMMEGLRGFPLLHLYGAAGSGKTDSAALYCAIAGADYRVERPMNVPSSTPYPIKEEASSTTTIPRIYDEVNPQKMPEHKYSAVRDALKAAFTANSMPVGSVRSSARAMARSGATRVEYAATSPMIYCATQATVEAELYDRSLEVHIIKAAHDEAKYRENFNHCKRIGWPALFKVAKRMMLTSLRVTTDQVVKMHEDALQYVPAGVKDRSAVGLATVVIGMNHLYRALKLSGMPEDLLAKVLERRDQTLQWWHQNAGVMEARKGGTEIDSVLRTLSTMAQHTNDGLRFEIAAGIHYVKTNTALYFNLAPTFSAYVQFCRRLGMHVELIRAEQLDELLKPEPYYMGMCSVPGSVDGRRWLGLSLSQMREKGIDVDGFRVAGA